MITREERGFFDDNGYLCVERVIGDAFLSRLQAAFDEAWETCEEKVSGGFEVPEHHLLKFRPFVELIEYAPILDRHKAIFGDHIQLVSYNLSDYSQRGGGGPDRGWHRDFLFTGDKPILNQTIIFLDDITPEKGPTHVVPGSHRDEAPPPDDKRNVPLEQEVPVPVPAGSAIFIHTALWHSAGRNTTNYRRRGVYMEYGYWWLKRYYYPGQERPLPWQALEGASPQRLSLLGLRMPSEDLHAGPR